MMKFRFFLPVVVLLFVVPSLFAQTKVGTAGEQFLKIGVSARVAGMGEAFVAIADDPSAIFYNPAGLSKLKRIEVLANHTALPAEIKYDFAGLVYPLPGFGGVLGAHGMALWMDDMEETEPLAAGDHWTGRYFTTKIYAGGLTYARDLTDKFSIGITVRYIEDRLADYKEDWLDEKANGLGGDVGTLYDTHFKSFKVGMSITNFGPDMKFIKESYPLPMNFKVGISFQPIYTTDHRLLIDMEGAHPNDNEERAIVGGEYTFRDLFSVRGGFKINYDTERFSVGTGFKVPAGPVKIKVDYAYTDWHYLSSMQRFSLGFLF